MRLRLGLLNIFLILLFGGLLFGRAAQAADVTITVNGSVVARPCNVVLNDTAVDLGNLYKFDLINPGSTSPWVNVNLSLNACPVGTSKVTASFSGPSDTSGYYTNQGSANNIAVELQDTGGKSLKAGTTTTIDVDDTTSTAVFPLRVRAVSVNGGPSAGSIKSVITVTYTYA